MLKKNFLLWYVVKKNNLASTLKIMWISLTWNMTIKKIIWLSILCEKKNLASTGVWKKKSSFKTSGEKNNLLKRNSSSPPPPQIMKWSLPKLRPGKKGVPSKDAFLFRNAGLSDSLMIYHQHKSRNLGYYIRWSWFEVKWKVKSKVTTKVQSFKSTNLLPWPRLPI